MKQMSWEILRPKAGSGSNYKCSQQTRKNKRDLDLFYTKNETFSRLVIIHNRGLFIIRIPNLFYLPSRLL